MSLFAGLLRLGYKLSGAKKSFGLPEEELEKVIAKMNRSRGVFHPTDNKAFYEEKTILGYPCLVVRCHKAPSERAILYFYGGGMVLGPDKGDLPVVRKLGKQTGCDIWFPFYPLCLEHSVYDTYEMAFACYREMIGIYG